MKLSKKDLVVWLIAIVLFAPCLLVVSEGHPLVNLTGFVYIGLLFLGARTNIGRMFIKRFMKIEQKLFNA